MTTSGSCSSISRSRPRPPSQVAEVVEEPAGRRELGDQPVLDVEQPGHPAEGDLGAVAQDRGADPAHRLEAVGDLDLGAGDLLFEVGLDDPRRQVVALADVGGQDQHPRRRAPRPGRRRRAARRRRGRCRSARAVCRGSGRAGGCCCAPTRRTCARPRGSSSRPSSRAPRARARWRSPCRGSRRAAAACGRSRSRRCFPAPARRFRGSSRPRRRRGCRCGRRPRARARRRCRRRGPRRR